MGVTDEDREAEPWEGTRKGLTGRKERAEESDEDGFEDTHIANFEQAMTFNGRPSRL